MSQTPAARRWAAIIDRHEQSGLTIRAFAAQNDLNPGTLAWWRSKLKRAQPQSVTFLELTFEKTPPHDSIDIRIDRINATIPVRPNTDLARLRAIIDALC